MEETTSYRYEKPIPLIQRSRKAVRQQEWRIRDDQKNASMIADLNDMDKRCQQANWSETRKHEICDLKRYQTALGEEEIIGNRTLLEVRQKALHMLLQDEDQIFQKELNERGLTLYRERQ